MASDDDDEIEAMWQSCTAPEAPPAFALDLDLVDAMRSLVAQQGINPEWRPPINKTCVELLDEAKDADPLVFVPWVDEPDDPSHEPGINALAERHPFPWDADIVFRARDHRYWFVDRDVMPRHLSSTLVESVSSVYGVACEPFTGTKSKEIAERTAGKSRAAIQRAHPDAFAALCASKRGRFDAIDTDKPSAFDALDVDELHPLEAVFGPITGRGVQNKWGQAGPLGTKFHAAAERYLNGAPQKDEETPEFKQFLAFAALPEHSREMVHRTEHNVFFAPLRITGQVDALYRTNEPGVFDIYDWKRIPDLFKPACFTEEFIRVFPTFGRTKFHKYALQLELYRFCYAKAGVRVRNCYLCTFHPDQKTFTKRQTPRCGPQIVWCLRKRQERLRAMLGLPRPSALAAQPRTADVRVDDVVD